MEASSLVLLFFCFCKIFLEFIRNFFCFFKSIVYGFLICFLSVR